MPGNQLEALAHAAQHAQAQHVDLEDAQRIEVVLVPFDDGAVGHGRVGDGRELAQGPAGDDEAADVLREMPGKAPELVGQLQRHGQPPVGGIEAGLAHPLLGQPLAAAAATPDGTDQRPGHILRQAQRLTDLAHRAARAVADDGGRQAGAVTAVFLVNVLDHLLAALVLEVDVDVGRLVALGRDEALEQQIDAVGIDGGDAEAIADRRIGGRAAALAEDAARPREADDVVDGKKVGRVAELGDQFELARHQPAHAFGEAIGVAPGGALPAQAFELGLWRAPTGHHFVGVVVAQFLEAEGGLGGDLAAPFQGLGVVGKEPRHLGRRLEVALGVGLQAPARLVDGAVLADTGQHIL